MININSCGRVERMIQAFLGTVAGVFFAGALGSAGLER